MPPPLPVLVLWTCAFLLAIAAIEHYLRRAVIPALCWMLLAGVAYGAVMERWSLPALRLEGEVILYVFLPLLIFDSARSLPWRDLRAVALEASLFATVGLLLTAGLLGAGVASILDVPLADALVVGAALAATDPIAVTAIFSRLGLPSRLRTLVEAESLLNDGTTVILFSVVAAGVMRDAPIAIDRTLLAFVWKVGGALAFGAAMGAAGGLLIRLWHALRERFVGALLPLVFAYLTFTLGEHTLEVSGVIAVMAATLALRRLTAGSGQKQPEFFGELWEFVGYLANTLLFFALGVEIGHHPFALTWWSVAGFLVVLLAARAATVYAGSAALRLGGLRIPISWQHVLNIGGLKGAVSVALVLLVPPDYEHRELFLCAALVAVLFTLVANSLAMRVYLGRATLPEQ